MAVWLSALNTGRALLTRNISLLLVLISVLVPLNPNSGHSLKTLEYARELYRPSDRRLSAKLVPIFTERGCCVVRAADPLLQ
jgi:hypothetical protein